MSSEHETVTYSGRGLEELLGSAEMRAVSELDISLEKTVVMRRAFARPIPNVPRPPESEDRTSASLAPVAFSVGAVPVVTPQTAAPSASRGSTWFFVGAVGLMFGLLAGLTLSQSAQSSESSAAAAKPSLARQAERHERAEEKTPLVAIVSGKAEKAVTPGSVKRSRAPQARGIRPSGQSGAASANADESASEAAADERLIRAAQLERSF